MRFDLDGARKAGATDDQIAAFLAEKSAFDLDGARKAGATDGQIAEFLASQEPEPPGFFSRAISGINDYRKSLQNDDPYGHREQEAEQLATFDNAQANAAEYARRENDPLRRGSISGMEEGRGPVSVAERERQLAMEARPQIPATDAVHPFLPPTDQEIARARVGAGARDDAFATEIDAERERTIPEIVSDVANQAGMGVRQIVGSPASLAAPDSDVAKRNQASTEDTFATLSPTTQANIKRAAAKIEAAAEGGRWDEVKAVASEYGTNPVLWQHFIATTLPSMLGVLGPAKAAQAFVIMRGGSAAAASSAGLMAAGGANAVLTGGDARQNAYDDLLQTFLKSGVPEDEAKARAYRESHLSAGVGMAFGFLGGRYGAESNLLGGAVKGSAVRKGLTAFMREVGTELPEELAPLVATNALASSVDGRALAQDVPATTGQTIIGVGPMATIGAAGAIARKSEDELLSREIDRMRFDEGAISRHAAELLSPDRAQLGARVDAGSVQNIGAASNVDEAIAAANAAAGEIIDAPQVESFAVSQQQDDVLSGLEHADPLDATFARGQELGAQIQAAPAPAQVDPLNAALASGVTVSEEVANAPTLDAAGDQGSSDLPGGSAGNTPDSAIVGAGVRGAAGALAPSSGTNQPVGERARVEDDALSQPEAAPIDQAALLESAARAASESQGQTLYRTPHKGLAMAQANRFRNSLGVPVEMSQAANGEWLVTRAQQPEQAAESEQQVKGNEDPFTYEGGQVKESQNSLRIGRGEPAPSLQFSRSGKSEPNRPVAQDDLLTLFNEAETIEIKAPSMSEQEIDDAEASFLSDFPEGSRYTRKTRLLERVRRESGRAFVQVKDAPGRLRRNARPLGPFSEYETRAEALEPDSFNPAGSLQVSVFGKEQVADGLIDEPALTITVTPDGDLTINGPSPAGETFREFQSRGWADRAKGAGGEVQPGWSALKDPANPDKTLPIQQIIPLLADVHARVRAWRGDEYVGLHWSRATGAMGGLAWGDQDTTAVYFSRKGQDEAAPTAGTGITTESLRAAIAERIPSLSKAVDNMLARGEKGQRGGLVIIDSADEQAIADAVASKTGLSADESLEDVQASLRIFSDGVRRTGDFIVPETPEFAGNTSGDLAYLNDKPIRLTVGVHRGSHRGFGLVKLAGEADADSSGRREPPIYTDDRAENFARHVVAVANSAMNVYEETGKTIIWSPRMREALVLEDMGTHWSIVSLRPARQPAWGRPVQTGRGGFQSLSQRSASAPLLSPGAEATPLPGRQSLGVQTEHFDLTNPPSDKQERIGAREEGKTAKVTVKKRRKIDPLFSSNGTIQGFYEKESGLTFLVGPNLTADTAPAVLLHEAIHGQQRADIDMKAMQMIDQRDLVAHPKHTREFMGRVYGRMVQAGAVGDATEAAAYIVEQAVIEGRQAGFSAADGKFMDWVDATLGKRIGNILRDFVAMIRGWAIRRGAAWNPTVDDLVAIAMAAVKGAARGDVKTSGNAGVDASRRATVASGNLPDAIVANPLGAAMGADHDAGKAGDVDAAMRLARRLITPDVIAKLRDQVPPGAVVVGVDSLEATGANAIPAAAATVIASDMGLDVDRHLVQSTKPKRTTLSGLDRVFRSPEFDGEVERGKAYVLVDDTITQGGTFAALASHIEQNGGRVAAIVALTGKDYSSKLSPEASDIERLRAVHGDIEDAFRQATGYDFAGLTASEARYLANYRPANAVRDRVIAEAQARSAGADASDPSSRLNTTAPGKRQYSIAASPPAGAPPAAALFSSPALPDGKVAQGFEKVRYSFQDRYIDLKKIQDAIRESGRTIRDEFNPYMMETLMHGKAAYRVQRFMETEVEPILNLLRAAKIDIPTFERYLHARHAKERNAHMLKINPNQAELATQITDAEQDVQQAELDVQQAVAQGSGVGAAQRALQRAESKLSALRNTKPWSGTEADRRMLSGMSDADAAKILAGAHAGPQAGMYRTLAARIDAITARTRQEMRGYGLETGEAMDAMDALYKHYVPLQREMDDSDLLGTTYGTGAGISIRGSSVKRATGSLRDVDNILANIVAQRESTVVRGEKNIVGKALYGLALEHPNTDLWTVIRPDLKGADLVRELQAMGLSAGDIAAMKEAPTVPTINERTGLVEHRINPAYARLSNAIVIRVAGQDRVLLLSTTDDRAVRLAAALRNDDTDHGGAAGFIMKTVGPVTRYLASINTQYNPVFGLKNFTRDLQEAMLNLESTEINGKQKEMVSRVLGGGMSWNPVKMIAGDALKGIWNWERGDKSHPWASIYEEFLADGGATGFRDQFTKIEDRAKAIQKELARSRFVVDWPVMRQILPLLSDYNTALENGIRLAAYKAARDSGMSRPKAANLAKDITVNFNRKGARSGLMASMYAFFNAAAQGIERALRTIASPAGKKIIVGGLSLGVLQAVVGMFALGDDWDEIPEFERSKNLIIPLPWTDQRYIKIPLPLGFYYIPNLSRTFTEMAVYQDRMGERTADLLAGTLDAFNPLGTSSVLSMVAPSVIDPFVEIATNADHAGRPIYQEDFNSLDPTPGHSRARRTTSFIATGLSRAINTMTGGDEDVPGMISMPPEIATYAAGVATGGLGREIGKAFETGEALFRGNSPPPYRVPLVGSFYGAASGDAVTRKKYYNALRAVNIAENSFKGRIERDEDIDALTEARAALAKLGRKMQNQISDLHALKDEEQDRDARKEIEAEIVELQRQFVEMFEEDSAEAEGK